MIGSILGFIGWLLAIVFSWLFFLLLGVFVGFYLRSFADPAVQAKGFAENILSAMSGWVKRKSKDAATKE